MDNDFYKNQIKRLSLGYAYHKIVFDSNDTPCDYIFLKVNTTFEKLTGLKAEDIINKKATVILPGLRSGDTDWVSIYGEVAANQSELDFIAYSDALDTHYKIHASSDKAGYFTTIFTYDTNHSFKTLFMNMNNGAVIYKVINDGTTARDYIIEDINDYGLSLEKKSREEVIGKSVFEIRDKVEDFGLINIFNSVFVTGLPQKMPPTLYPDGKVNKWYENQVFKLSKNEIVALYTDVTEIIQNQIDLENSNSKLKSVINLAPYGIFIADKEGNYVDVNPEACKITGYNKNELIGMNLADISEDDYKIAAKKHFSKLKKTHKDPLKGKGSFITKSGEKRYWSIKASKLNENRYLGLAEDITESLILENKLEQSLNSIHQAETIAKLGFFTKYWQTEEAYFSEGYLNLLGLEKGTLLKHQELMESIHIDDKARVKEHIKETLKNPNSLNIQFRIIKKDNTIIHVNIVANHFYDSNDNPLTTVGVIQDITTQVAMGIEKMKLEEFISKKQRLESIGTLASGVAHEINNPLNGILNYGQLILDTENVDNTTKVYAKEIIRESERVATIVKNLLDFSRQNNQAHSYANIEDIIRKTTSLINTIIKHDQIDLQISIAEDISRIKCRSQQIQQVIMNLLTNARDALNEKYKGYHENKIINISCKEFIKEDRKWISITVTDNGSGIPDEIKDKIFDPFFSTKDKNLGTGLGLSISYGIVDAHHGEVLLETKKDEYTQFTVLLPCDNGWDLE